ncbi:MAG: hypothetical protein M1355_01775 [Patescibacteria group bacterium]|nr:hypothetical protein [Patescibacteria group bacterium]
MAEEATQNTQPAAAVPQKKGKGKLLVIILFILAVLGVGGYFGYKQVTAYLAQKAILAQCKYKDATICRHLYNLKEIKYMSAKSAMTDKSGKKSEYAYDMNGDRYHTIATENGKEIFNTIAIADKVYMKDYSDNKWWMSKNNKDVEKNFDEFEPDYQVEENDTKTQIAYKYIGKEKVNGVNCYKYQVSDPNNKDMTEDLIWFDTKDYLLRKMSSKDKDGNTYEETFSYNKVEINEPSPVKEATSQLDMLGGLRNALPNENIDQMQQDAQNAIDALMKYYNATPTETPVETPVE